MPASNPFAASDDHVISVMTQCGRDRGCTLSELKSEAGEEHMKKNETKKMLCISPKCRCSHFGNEECLESVCVCAWWAYMFSYLIAVQCVLGGA